MQEIQANNSWWTHDKIQGTKHNETIHKNQTKKMGIQDVVQVWFEYQLPVSIGILYRKKI